MSKPTTLKIISKQENSKIYDTDCFKDGLYFLEKFKNKRNMCLLDMDNTIVSFRHTLGTDQWFDFDYNEFIKKGLTAAQAKLETIAVSLDYLHKIHPEDVYAVEEDTPAVIRKMQTDGVETLLLTSRGTYLLAQTREQLSLFGIDFNQGRYPLRGKKLPQSKFATMIDGMILTDGRNKGECLISCLQDRKNLPQVIVMWDDKLHNLERVRDEITKLNQQMKGKRGFVPIQFIGLRYSKLDHQVKNVKENVVALQKKYFQRILPDKHAEAIIKAENKAQRRYYVDIDYQAQKMVKLSIHKAHVYQILKQLMPSIDQYRVLGELKVIDGKPKLTWQFELDVKAFKPLFHLLSQHGLITSNQFTTLSPVFHEPSPILTHAYQLRRGNKDKNYKSPNWPESDSRTKNRVHTMA